MATAKLRLPAEIIIDGTTVVSTELEIDLVARFDPAVPGSGMVTCHLTPSIQQAMALWLGGLAGVMEAKAAGTTVAHDPTRPDPPAPYVAPTS